MLEERTNLLLLQIRGTKNNEPPTAYICSLASWVVLQYCRVDNFRELKAIVFALLKKIKSLGVNYSS
jgi:hypothetical protein